LSRVLRLEFALAALLLAPLLGYAIVYLLAGDAGRVTRATPTAPVQGVLQSASPLADPLPAGSRVSILGARPGSAVRG